jgi:PAS domain S-box-containing protein
MPEKKLFYCSVTDISGHKQGEASLTQSSESEKPGETTFMSPVSGTDEEKARYHRWMDNIIENYTDGFFTLSRNWTVIAFNQMAQRMVHLPKRSLINANFWSLFPVEPDHRLYREARRSLAKNQTVHFEEFYPHLNKWLEITAYPDNDTVTLFFKDTTIRKEQELDLQHLAEDYKILFANNPLPMWAYDLDKFRIVMVNNAALSLYGYTRKEFLALSLYDLRPESEHERLKEELKQKDIFRDLKLSSEWLHKKKDGTIMYVDIASHQIKLNDHRARLIVANNITDRRKAQNKMEAQNKQLKEIAQISSHDLRGPVASILGLVSLFDESNADINLNKQIIKHLESCAKDMDKVIHTIVKKTYEEGM